MDDVTISFFIDLLVVLLLLGWYEVNGLAVGVICNCISATVDIVVVMTAAQHDVVDDDDDDDDDFLLFLLVWIWMICTSLCIIL